MLSSAGKHTLLKSVLLAIPNYTMSCFKLPVSLCKRIQSLLTRFWWDNKPGKKKMAWVAWKKLSQPKGLGGLGFKDILQFNDALLAKVSWRILQHPSSLLARILLSKYCSDVDFLDCTPSSTISHGWRGILLGRDVLKLKLLHVVGNGSAVKLWKDPWLPSLDSRTPIGPPREDEMDCKVNSLFNSDNSGWDVDKIKALLPHLQDHILSIKPSCKRGNDKWYWEGTKDGEYTTKSGYFSIVDHEQDVQNRSHFPWLKDVWRVQCPPKIQVFLWKILNKALPVGDALKSHGIQGQFPCPLCGQDESINHLLFLCPFALDVWSLVQWKSSPPPFGTSLEENYLSVLKLIVLPPVGIGQGPLAPWLLWNLWKTRNALVFQKRSFSRAETVLKTICDAREWQIVQHHSPSVACFPKVLPSVSVSPPSATKAFCDAAWDSNLLVAGTGSVFLHPLTRLTRRSSEVFEHVRSPLVAEGLGILATLKQALSLGVVQLHIFSDSKECVDAINKHLSHREVHGIICDIQSLSHSFEDLSFSFISRALNSEADSIAKSVLSDFRLFPNIVV